MEKRKIKKELIEWIAILSIFGIIYLTGWHTEIIGRVQQVVLSSGIISPTIATETKQGSYDFWIEDLDGNRMAFETFKSQVVFMNFWATWCPPCIAEMPDINSLYRESQEKVNFIMISLDQDENKARQFMKRKKFDFPVYFLRSALPKVYNTRAIPTTYVLDTEGKIIVENHGMAKYNSEKFKQLLSNLINKKGTN